MAKNLRSLANSFAHLRLSIALIILLLIEGVVSASTATLGISHSMDLPERSSWTTPCYALDSGVKGPTIAIVAGQNSDEPAGAYVAEQVRYWRIARGKLIILPRANPSVPTASAQAAGGTAKNDDLAYGFPRTGERAPALHPGAQAIWRMIQEQKPDWVLELREGQDFSRLNPKSAGASLTVFPSAETDRAAGLMLDAVNAAITSPTLKFLRLEKPANGSLACAAGARLGSRAMILETTTKSQALSLRVRQQRIMIHCLLTHLGMIDATTSVYQMTGRKSDPRAAWVAVYDAEGTGGPGASHIDEILSHTDGMRVARIGPDDIINNALEQFDVVIVPGGTGKGISKGLTEAGCKNMQEFVRRGGGYIGICAGAFLAADFSWGLKIINAKTVSPLWRRGRGTVKAELTDEGRKTLGDRSGPFEILYVNGPILMPAAAKDLPPYQTWAIFRTEMAKNNTPAGVMTGSPAIIASTCGKGRVVCISPHPEQTKGLEDFIRRAVTWASGEKH
ncbi:MAG: BPL-N domain-containing protein [Candidatus Sumerlaeota bacterium]|nr:BPL-N domain-containing protein [Candidatus Sumerlaeota bacterium]